MCLVRAHLARNSERCGRIRDTGNASGAELAVAQLVNHTRDSILQCMFPTCSDIGVKRVSKVESVLASLVDRVPWVLRFEGSVILVPHLLADDDMVKELSCFELSFAPIALDVVSA